jgi:endonuclease YncB( thermonuclease family)
MDPISLDKIRDTIRKKDFKDAKGLSLEGIVTLAKVLEVYDGDTIWVGLYDNNVEREVHMRLFGYDSPEMKPKKDIKDRVLHIDAAKVAANALTKRIGGIGEVVWVKFVKREKFGREMGYIFQYSNNINDGNFDNKKSINSWMIENGLGKKYGGEKKEEFSKEELLNIIEKHK